MNRPFSKYIFALLLFGSNGVFASMISLSSYEIVLLRSLLACLFMGTLLLLTKRRPTFLQHKKSFLLLCIGGIATGVSWMSLYEAYQRVGVSISTLCLYFGPAIIILISPILFKEKLTRKKAVSFLLVLLGMVLINGQAAGNSRDIIGFFCGLLSAFAYALAISCNKCAADITGLENSLIQMLFAFITSALFVGAAKGLEMQILPSDILPILVLGLVNTGIGCTLYLSSINVLPVQTVAICGYLEPLSAVVFSILLLHESLLPVQVIGTAFILGGAIYGEFRQKRIPAGLAESASMPIHK